MNKTYFSSIAHTTWESVAWCFFPQNYISLYIKTKSTVGSNIGQVISLLVISSSQLLLSSIISVFAINFDKIVFPSINATVYNMSFVFYYNWKKLK